MNTLPIILSCLFLNFLSNTSVQASSLRASGASGINSYKDYALTGRWSVGGKSKSKSKTKDQDESDSGSSISTSFENSNSSGSITNEYKLGYSSKWSEITSYDLSSYYRTEPSDVSVIGIQPEISFEKEGLLFNDLSSGLNLGFDFFRTTAVIQ